MVLQSQALCPTPPESLAQAGRPLPSTLRLAGLLTLLQGWAVPRLADTCRKPCPCRLGSHGPSLTSLTSLPCPNSWSSWGVAQMSPQVGMRFKAWL